MNLARGIRLGAWILVGLNLMMAFGSIWVFIRMAPAIETIIEQNERSLHACENMLAQLALYPRHADNPQFVRSFGQALERAQNNITEPQEPAVIATIQSSFQEMLAGKAEARLRTVTAIQQLSEINRKAMIAEDKKAQQFGNAGAWGIVFMASGVFLVGMLFMRSLRNSLVRPLEEIQSVVDAARNGDIMRRCTGPNAPRDIKAIFSGLNDILDKIRPTL